MKDTGAPWTVTDIEAALDEVTDARYDQWDLRGIGAGTSPDGIERGTVWIAKGSKPHPELLAWITGLRYPDMIMIRDEGVSLPGEGPWIDAPPGMQNVDS